MFGDSFQRWSVVCISLLFAGIAWQTASAQTQGERAIELERQRQEQLLKERELEQQTHTTLPAPELPSAKLVPDSSTCFDINSIEIDGVQQFSAKRLQTLYQSYLNTCMNIGHVNTLVGEITRLYLDAGFITSRAYLPQQNLSSGMLKITVVEGIVEAIEMSGGKQSLADTAFPGLIGKILNLREIEQGLDILNQASAQATVEFLPGEHIGGTKVLIKYTPLEKVSASVGIDNSGQQSTGTKKANFALNWNNPFKVNDSVYLNFQPASLLSNNENTSESFAFGYSLPYGKWKISGNYSKFDYLSVVYGSATTFESKGGSENIGLVVRRLLLRNQRSKYFVDMQLKQQDSENYIDDVLLQTSSRTYQSLVLALSQEKYFGTGSLIINNLSYTRGLGVSYSFEDDPQGLPDEKFNKINVDVDIYSSLDIAGKKISLQSGLHGQYSEGDLYSSENISIGSRYTVRGFNDTGLSDASGVYWRNDISHSISFGASGQYWQPYLGLDYGWVHDESLSGAAAGVKIKGKNFYTELGYSQALNKPTRLEDEGAIALVALTLNLRW